MEPREVAGKETMGSKRKNLTFLRSRLYMLERRKTDTVVDSSVSGDHSGSLRRSQSDRTEYNQKLQGKPKRKRLPQAASLSSSGFGSLPFAETFEAEETLNPNLPFLENTRKAWKGTLEVQR